MQFISLTFLMCALLLCGCDQLRKDAKKKSLGAGKIGKTPSEQKKAKLLKQIDRKFENPRAHFELGQLYQADGMWIQAENEYKTALNFEPAHKQAQAGRIKVLLALDDKDKAEFLNNEYMNQASNSAAGSLRLALAFQKQQLDEHALACYQQALHLAPNSAKINRQIGYYHLQAKNYLVRSFALNPNQPEVAGELGRLGIRTEIPRKTAKHTKKLDKIIEQSDKERKP
jgi:tetratricopeptide (TPR) repeat protein